jgi:glycosyltransferase involved in cell wall biosynthesis
MRIAIDATSMLLPGMGVRTYIHYWLASLLEAAQKRGDAIATYTPGITVPRVLDHLKSSAGHCGTQLRLRMVQLLNVVSHADNGLLNLFMLSADVFHCSQHTMNMPIRKKVAATVFDLSCWKVPEYHTAENIAATRRYGEVVLRRCDGLIAISEHTRQDAIDILGISGDRIRVIYPGVAEEFFEVTADNAADVRARYQLHKPYLLFAGCIEPRKNVPSILRAFRTLRQSASADVQLVLAGNLGWASEETQTLLDTCGKGIRLLGYVPERDMPGLFRGAAALVYPSFYEGFGLPVVQAMAAGTPVITSNGSCLPEVTGEAAIHVNPDSVEELGAAMDRVLSDTELARTLSQNGRHRSQRFHWAQNAIQTLEFFDECRRR